MCLGLGGAQDQLWPPPRCMVSLAVACAGSHLATHRARITRPVAGIAARQLLLLRPRGSLLPTPFSPAAGYDPHSLH